MFYRQQISRVFTHSDGPNSLHGIRNNSASRPLRLSLAFCLLLLLVPLSLAIVANLPQARLADGLQTLTNTLARLPVSVPWHAAPRQLPGDRPAQGNTGTPRSAAASGSSNAERGVIAYGDRLKITFFESLGVSLDDNGATSEHVVATVFPRMDLSAEYAVDDSGNVNIPKLGQFATEGRTIAALQSELAAAFTRGMGRTSDVHVAIVERQPIYVLGAVRNAGTFKHTPGMIVLQALADAGGIDSGSADTSKAIENIRETERLRQAEDKFDRLLIRQARLVAQRDNADSIRLPESIRSRLSGTASHDGLSSLIAAEATTLSVDRRDYLQLLSLAERQVNIARVELEAQNMRIDQVKVLLAKKESRLHDLEEIAAHGSVTQYKLTDMNVDIAELLAHQLDLRVASAQAERRVVEAETTQAKMEAEHFGGLQSELAATQQEIDDCTHAIASMQAVTRVLRNSAPEIAEAMAIASPGIRITRRIAAGPVVIAATETTSLLPGDVVQVGPASGSDIQASGIAQDVRRSQD